MNAKNEKNENNGGGMIMLGLFGIILIGIYDSIAIVFGYFTDYKNEYYDCMIENQDLCLYKQQIPIYQYSLRTITSKTDYYCSKIYVGELKDDRHIDREQGRLRGNGDLRHYRDTFCYVDESYSYKYVMMKSCIETLQRKCAPYKKWYVKKFIENKK